MRLIVALILTFLVSCDNRNSGQLSLKNSFDTCGNHSDKKDLRVYRLTDMEFKIPKDWKVRRNEKPNGVECMDTTLAKLESKIRTFTVYEFDAKNTNPKDYFDSQIKIIGESSMTVMETGIKLIEDIESYYVVTLDTVDNFAISQAYFYTDYSNKRYTIQIAVSSTNNPIDEICKSIWILDGIKLSVDD
jgi:hypothetical protein